ncbi:excinuclease ABC subunit UvrA [Aquirufa regiilacus]|uniref:UvrABC system protein A n=1 Tax=Aquirufa regiilacus TaxID=3024868 RepID=A0ABU3TUA3_9BACT|nr:MULTISPECIES: excinuclease ABC subunit UvrA [unclassified Aquirufa]MDT8887559.1 excinuclease ABC subunit UvrA [Aquirufa sp. LEPPI-3A]MDU0809429.1 excinuclease ABC subunit UvrA [Aquirufa sp. LEOWEIH-7C]
MDLTGFSHIEVLGAREHNLKNIDVSIPRNQLVVVTGISGSGKSSLAFDTIYAEGQRRYMESFSAYARSFLGNMERPDVDKIEGLSPVISIEQKTTSKNPRSTLGTVTEIYDFLRLLYARASEAYSYLSGEKMVKQSVDQIIGTLLSQFANGKVVLLAPVVKGRKGHYRELFVQIAKWGYTKVRVDGEVMDIEPKMQLDRFKVHDIEVVVDRLVITEDERVRLSQSLQTAMNVGKGQVFVLDAPNKLHYFSQTLMDPKTGLSYDEPAPNTFSFNSPYGACPCCSGLGVVEEITEESVIPDTSLSILRGAIAPIGEYRELWIFKQLEVLLKPYQVSLSTPIAKFPREAVEVMLYGTDEPVPVPSKKYVGSDWNSKYDGIINFLKRQQESGSEKTQDWLRDFLVIKICPECKGYRLKKEALHFKVADKHIGELAQMDIAELAAWLEDIDSRISERQLQIGAEVLKEIRKRVSFLTQIGLTYLTLDRPMKTLSGGESQRIRLATQIGTQLVGVLYIMDEPSIGLHQRDNEKLIQALKDLRDLGNSVLVVEHDKDMMLESDYILDIGPGAGRHGGQVIGSGTPAEFVKLGTPTAQFLNGTLAIKAPAVRRSGNGHLIELKGASGNNLKGVSVTFPLGKFITVTGVSGSGKSTLIHDTLVLKLKQHFDRSKRDPLPFKSISGLEHIDKIIEVDQSPIGRTPRSNPATYTNMYTDIRALYCELPESKIRGYKAGRFSFNVKGGRCEDCEGAGRKKIEMEFLPDVLVECETCKGKRFNRETLEVRFKGKSISDVLDMTVEQALEFFEHQPRIHRRVQTLSEVGLGYITLGQHATTLSGGEAQRVKLAEELSKKDTGKTLYVLDEPTTGLHFQDVKLLLDVLQKLVDKGNTVLIIEHNLDVVKVSDYVIDMGPEGGNAGGKLVASGTPEEICKVKGSETGRFLKKEM